MAGNFTMVHATLDALRPAGSGGNRAQPAGELHPLQLDPPHATQPVPRLATPAWDTRSCRATYQGHAARHG